MGQSPWCFARFDPKLAGRCDSCGCSFPHSNGIVFHSFDPHLCASYGSGLAGRLWSTSCHLPQDPAAVGAIWSVMIFTSTWLEVSHRHSTLVYIVYIVYICIFIPPKGSRDTATSFWIFSCSSSSVTKGTTRPAKSFSVPRTELQKRWGSFAAAARAGCARE